MRKSIRRASLCKICRICSAPSLVLIFGISGAGGGGTGLAYPNSAAMSAGKIPENRIAKKLRNADEIRDNERPLPVRISTVSKFDLLQQHDLMILPSHDENFGNVVIESLSVGTAVLITKNVGLADYISGNDLGWVCDLDENSISYYINGLAMENDKLQAIRKQAPSQIRENFSEESLTEKYIDMYNQIINNG